MKKNQFSFIVLILIVLIIFFVCALYYFTNLNPPKNDLETLLSNFNSTQLCESLKLETTININSSIIQISPTTQTTTLEISGEKYDISLKELEEFCLNN